MRLIVCGGRAIGQVAPDLSGKAAARDTTRASAERKFVLEQLSRLHEETPITLLIAGEEGGTGSVSLNWARVNKVPSMPWRRLKFPKSTLLNTLTALRTKERASDYILETFEDRNARMLAGSSAEMLLAFGGGQTTQLLVEAARDKGLKIMEIEIPDFSRVSVSAQAP